MAKILSTLLLLVAIPACDSDNSISLSDLPAATVDALCTYSARCGQMPDVASCKAAAGTDMGQLSADVQAGKIKYDGKAAAACLDAMRSASCNHSDPFNEGEPQACKDALKGTVADNGVCYSGSECVSGSCGGGVCSGSGCCQGTCNPSAGSAAAIPIAGACGGSGAVCVAGAFCNDSTCQAKAAVGQSCATSFPEGSCVTGAYCVANGSDTGTCGKLPAEGQSCYPAGVSYLSACDSMLDCCDSVSLKCVPKIAVGGDCSGGASCVGYAACDATGRCVAKARAGESCDDVNGPQCLGSLFCESGKCTLPSAPTVVCQ
jgi:hypothetical protein